MAGNPLFCKHGYFRCIFCDSMVKILWRPCKYLYRLTSFESYLLRLFFYESCLEIYFLSNLKVHQMFCPLFAVNDCRNLS